MEKLRKSSGIRDGTHDRLRTSNKREKSFRYHLLYYMVVIVLYLIERLINKRNVFENMDVRSGGKWWRGQCLRLPTGYFCKPGPNKDESWWEFKLSLLIVWPETLMRSHALSSAQNALKFFVIVDENFLSFPVTLDGLSSTLVLVWPELMILDESWCKLSSESTLSDSNPRLARDLACLLCCSRWFLSVYETLVCDHSNKRYWAVLSCGTVQQSIMLYKVVLTFKSVDETLVCDHSNEAIEQYFHVLLFIMLYMVVLTFESVDVRLLFNILQNETYLNLAPWGVKELMVLQSGLSINIQICFNNTNFKLSFQRGGIYLWVLKTVRYKAAIWLPPLSGTSITGHALEDWTR